MPIQLFESEDHASTYVRARPSPPASLINAIVDFLDSGNLRNENGSWPKAVDVGAGSGQTTFLIKDYFDEILGVDISAAQIAEANKRNKYPNISFKVARAESIPLEDKSVNLLTASQCLHWFDLTSFYEEVDRLLAPGGVFAAFGYICYPIRSPNDCPVADKMAQLIEKAFNNLEDMGLWEQPAMNFLHSKYENLKLPYRDSKRITNIICPVTYSGESFLDYITSWSAYNTLASKSPEKADIFIEDIANRMKDILGTCDFGSVQIKLNFEFFLLMARK
ncbi:putative methyltransferase DDB_G0268948 [Tetranychus urticae]|uniref:Methyltransferase type 11 domain-containing protein n=1 Tax=Tetranychus urticae TaxID=32264 RepID=T1KZW6_TETUR|nr:putative methyltransferase DDB_G0268948 [Tetranychus urticae]